MDKCVLCKSSKADDFQYGEIVKNEEVMVHTFCLYLTSNLIQRGDEDEGIFGFMLEDIKKEERRISKLTCCYCSKRYANIGCCKVQCRRSFHLICGIENGVENQFIGTFNSYCHKHARKHNSRKPRRGEKCCICYEKLMAPGQRFSGANMLLAPCCTNGWFHKLCMQKFAMSAGYFLKCPLCNDTQIFCQKLPLSGIFIPERDASWELEPHAFAELLERPNACAAEECRCVEGRKKTSYRNPLLLCNACGSVAMHKKCLPDRTNKFWCNDCSFSCDSGRSSLNSRGKSDTDNDSDVVVDVEGVSEEYNDDLLIGLRSNTLPGKARNGTTKEEVKSDAEYIQPPKDCNNLEVIQINDDSSLDEEFIRCSPRATVLEKKNLIMENVKDDNKDNICHTKFVCNDDEQSIIFRSRCMHKEDSILKYGDASRSCNEDIKQCRRNSEMRSKARSSSKSTNSNLQCSKNDDFKMVFHLSGYKISYENSQTVISISETDEEEECRSDNPMHLNKGLKGSQFNYEENAADIDIKCLSFDSKRRKTYDDDSDCSSDEFKHIKPYNVYDSSSCSLEINNDENESADELEVLLCSFAEDLNEKEDKNQQLDKKADLEKDEAYNSATEKISDPELFVSSDKSYSNDSERKSISKEFERISASALLDGSCIAHRTRRKSLFIETNASKDTCSSSVVRNTRRNSVIGVYTWKSSDKIDKSETKPEAQNNVVNSFIGSLKTSFGKSAAAAIKSDAISKYSPLETYSSSSSKSSQSSCNSLSNYLTVNETSSSSSAAVSEVSSLQSYSSSSSTSSQSSYNFLSNDLTVNETLSSSSSSSLEASYSVSRRVKSFVNRMRIASPPSTRRRLSTYRNESYDESLCPMRTLRSNTHPYITPKFTRVNGRLRKVETMPDSGQQRFYNFLRSSSNKCRKYGDTLNKNKCM